MQMSNDSSIYSSRVAKNQQEKYKKIKVLGEGSMGKVYLVQCPLENNNLYVMKRINIGHLQPKQKQQALSQAQLHNMVKHENIIQFKQIYHTTKDKLCIIMEYADGGDLDQLLKDLKQNKKFLSEEQILKYFVQICLALKEIHDKKIVHRDLKGANIFLAKQGKIKIGDFGISKAMDKTVLASKSFVGTPFYLSPEMVEGKPYSTKADVWALGVILYHMTALKLPFDANSLPVLALKILKGSYPQIPSNAYSKDLKALISSMLQVDQRKRPSVGEILNKPILSKYLPKQFFMTITPKIKAKVEIKTQKIKLATTRSKKQLKIQNQKLSEDQKKKRRQQQKVRREQQRKKMRQDIKFKRQQGGQTFQGQLQLTQPSRAIQIQTINTAQIPKKQPPKAKPVSSSKNIKQTKQQMPKSPRNVQKPWKNKNLIKQRKQPEIQIILPGQKRKSLPDIQQGQKILPKGKDIPVQIFVNGQNPYRNKPQTLHQQTVKSPFNNSNLTQSNLISESYQASQQIEEQMDNNSYGDSNFKDLLANVQKAQNMVDKLSNIYEKNNIELYEQSVDFDNTMNYPSQKNIEKSSKKFENNQSDIENMKYITNITDGENLEELRQILQDRLGQEGFIRAHQIVKQFFQQNAQMKNNQQTDVEQTEAYLFDRKILRQKLNFITPEQFDRNIELLYTISVMEDMEMMKNFDSDSDDFSEDGQAYNQQNE